MLDDGEAVCQLIIDNGFVDSKPGVQVYYKILEERFKIDEGIKSLFFPNLFFFYTLIKIFVTCY